MTIAIAGVGETAPSFCDPRPVPALAVDACRLALADAGLTPADVDGFVTESFTFASRGPVDEVAARLGVPQRPFSAHIGIAGAGTVGAPMLARMAIESGRASVVLSYYAINLSHRAPGGVYAMHAAEPAKAAFEMPFGFYGQPVYFAVAATRYAHEHGLTDDQLGAIAITHRANAQRTPGALRQQPLDLDGYKASRMVAEPLRALDCCLVNDAGVAFVMTSVERARDLAHPPVVLAGVGFGSKPVNQAQYFSQGADLLTTAATESGPAAYRDAGVGPSDVDVALVYDCFSISLLLQMEDLGLSPRGGAAQLWAEGRFDLDGALPVNTHGGLLSQSYSVGAGHVVEAVHQLRGTRGAAQVPGAEVALVAGLGAPEHATLLLTVDR